MPPGRRADGPAVPAGLGRWVSVGSGRSDEAVIGATRSCSSVVDYSATTVIVSPCAETLSPSVSCLPRWGAGGAVEKNGAVLYEFTGVGTGLGEVGALEELAEPDGKLYWYVIH